MFLIVKQQEKADKRIFGRNYIFKKVQTKTFSFDVLELKRINLINSNVVAKIIGKRRVLMSKEISDICERKYNIVSSREFEQRLFINGIKKLFSNHKNYDYHASCVLVDIQAKFVELADFLVDAFKSVSIITRQMTQYHNFADGKFFECGAVVFVKHSSEAFNGDIVISPEKDYLSTGKGISGVSVVQSFPVHISDYYRQYLPCGIDEHLFMASVYKYCGVCIYE